MELKPQHNRKRIIEILRAMTPEQRINKAFELSDMTKRLFRQGLREVNPTLSETEFHQLYLKKMARCHNQNY